MITKTSLFSTKNEQDRLPIERIQGQGHVRVTNYRLYTRRQTARVCIYSYSRMSLTFGLMTLILDFKLNLLSLVFSYAAGF